MRSLPSCPLLVSIVFGAVAIILALKLPQGFQIPFIFLESEVHCYQSVQTSAHDPDTSPKCFSTSSSGTIAKVWKINSDKDIPKPAKLQPGAVIPGLWDGHGHVIGLGDTLAIADLYFAANLEDTTSRLKRYAEEHPDAGTKINWLRGSGWDQAAYGRMPTADDLDAVFPGKFIMLTRVDAHCIWVSSAVLDLLPDPIPEVPGGEVIGKGVFCDNAMDMVHDKWPKPGEEETANTVKNAMRALNKVGVVGVHEAGVTPETLEMYKSMAETDDWTVRVYAMLECKVRNTFCGDQVDMFTRDDGLLSMKSVKLFSDGALGSWGSAMLEPYADKPESMGSLLIDASTIKSLTLEWAKAGYQVNIHAIGDAANRYVIDAFEAALTDPSICSSPKKDCQLEKRFRIEHSQIISPVDQQRLHAELGILPSIQPTHATSDMAYAESRLGLTRLSSSAYRLRSLLFPPSTPHSHLGPNIILGSDFPVEPPAPLHGMYAAIARKSPNSRKGPPGDPEGGFLTSEALGMGEALAGFTTGPAWGGFMEGKAGEIKKGMFADWVVLEKSLEEVETEELLDLKVMETWMAGRRVYKA
jgi:predicted amidohydrolase YtcJ